MVKLSSAVGLQRSKSHRFYSNISTSVSLRALGPVGNDDGVERERERETGMGERDGNKTGLFLYRMSTRISIRWSRPGDRPRHPRLPAGPSCPVSLSQTSSSLAIIRLYPLLSNVPPSTQSRRESPDKHGILQRPAAHRRPKLRHCRVPRQPPGSYAGERARPSWLPVM